jgi:hypothetical protein
LGTSHFGGDYYRIFTFLLIFLNLKGKEEVVFLIFTVESSTHVYFIRINFLNYMDTLPKLYGIIPVNLNHVDSF